jgi:thermolysin
VLVRGEALRREVFVDAVTARVVHERQALYAASEHGSGIGVLGERRMLDVYRGSNGYELRDDTRGERGIRTTSAGGTFAVPGKVVRSHDPQAWDEDVFGAGAAVDAHANGAIVWDYLDRVLGRSSWDGDGGALRLVVHSGEHVANAYWDGRYAVFGDGDGDSMLALPAALDIVAHEIFHGVTGSEAGLIYEGQSGALSESLSDVFGSLVEIDAGDGDWRIGGAIADPPLRDLAQPWRTGAPSHMREYLHLPLTPDGDMGGVHLNSTIPSHAAVLIADGGVHAISHIKVAAVGRDAMRNVWWRAVTVYLTPRATFSEFARATIVSAEDLFGADDPQTASVRQAWRAVGVTQ